MPLTAERASEIVVRLSALLPGARSTDERCALVLAIGEAGGDTRAFLDDPSQPVRCCASLSAKYDSRALVEILEALVNPAQIDAWFQVKPSYFERRPRFSFVQAAIERAESFDQLAPAAIAVARVTSKHVVDAEWGPLLVAALSPGRPAGPLTPAQSAFLLALCQNEAVWAPRFGNPLKWFRQVGLPYDRQRCLSVATTGRRD